MLGPIGQAWPTKEYAMNTLLAAPRGALRRWLPAAICAAFATAAAAQTEQVTFSFKENTTGNSPRDNGYTLVLPNGHVMGTAQNGGDGVDGAGAGVVFEEIPPTTAKPHWRYHEIYRFQGPPQDGADPADGLTKGKDGILYGLTTEGGAGSIDGDYGCGVVYQLTPPKLTGTGSWAESVLYYFRASDPTDGCEPNNTQLLFDNKTGSLYGTTFLGGGTAGGGTLFRLDPPTQAGSLWNETILYRFLGGSDGGNPSGGLAVAGDLDAGTIYGTTQNGGSSAGAGVVWQYNTSTGEMTTVYTFLGNPDGASPRGGVIGPFPANPYGSDFYLLGTTAAGGGSANCSGGCGTVFAIYMPAARRKKLVQIKGDVNAVNAEDVILGAGYDVKIVFIKQQQQNGVQNTEISGTILATASGRGYHSWQISPDQKIITTLEPTSEAHTLIPGLTLGQIYYVRSKKINTKKKTYEWCPWMEIRVAMLIAKK